MGKVLVMENPGQIGFLDYEEAPLNDNEARIHMMYSGISAGTQLTLYRGNNPSVSKTLDPEHRLFIDKKPGDPSAGSLYPSPGCWAYEEVGRIAEVGAGVTGVAVGDIVYGAWGHRSTQIVTEQYAKEHLLPEGLDPIVGIYAQMGAIAMNAILDADIHVGENVAVFGLGVPGQIICQLARLNGATVFAVDKEENRLKTALRLGADHALNTAACDVGREIKRLTGRGADKSIEISGFSGALHEAIRSTVYNGRVVCAGFIVGAASQLCLGEEFHINRIQIIGSQIDGVNPSVSNAWNRLRKEKTIMSLVKSGKLNLMGLISEIVSFKDAADAYRLLDTSRKCLQVVLSF